MNKNNKNIIKIVLIIIILFLIMLFLIYYLNGRKIESFFDAKKYILENCNDNFGLGDNDCIKSAWIQDPAYLCGICDSKKSGNITMLQSIAGKYFGCDNENAANSYGLQWQKNNSLGTYTKFNNFITDLLTCNTFNVDVTSGMYIFLCGDDYASFTINGKTVSKTEGWNYMGMYYVENVKYRDNVKLEFQNVCTPGGFNISYIWNKQLFILDQNGFENVANIINYTVTGTTGWTTYWKSSVINDILPPWMYNWVEMEYCNSCSGCSTTSTMLFKVGDTKNKGLLNGDLQGWIGIDDTCSVYVNDVLEYTQANVSSWSGTFDYIGWTGNFTVSNVQENSVIKIVGYNGGGPAGLGFTYLWNGLIFCLPSNLANFDKCAFQMNYETENEAGGMTYGNGGFKNFPWEKSWLNFSSNVGNFQLVTKVSTKVINIPWVYTPTKNTYYTIAQNTLVGDWSITRIKNSARMTVSFWINISELYSDWRNIFHVTNGNTNCCYSGDRIPAMWICPGTTQLYIRHSTASWGDDGPGCSSYQVPLNTNVFLTIVFNSNTMTLYANASSQQTFTFTSPLISANSNAKFYIADPWHYAVKYKIKNFSLYNSSFSSSEVNTLYQDEMGPSSSTSDTNAPWVYSPTKNTFYTVAQNTLVGNWSITSITSSAMMTVSFWINVSELNSDWRNIFHLSNQNVDCCNSGSRIPAMWICPGNTQLYIRHSTASWGDDGPGCSSYQIPLNTDVFLTIVFTSNTMTFYANAVSQQTFTFTSALIPANSSASFYISDPWYKSGGYKIKNFTLYNSSFSSSEVSTLYQNESQPANSNSISTPIVCGAYNFCVNTENNNTNYYCYGQTDGCLWNTNDCVDDSDCSKYTNSSPRYTDPGQTCQALTTASGTEWQNDACRQ